MLWVKYSCKIREISKSKCFIGLAPGEETRLEKFKLLHFPFRKRSWCRCRPSSPRSTGATSTPGPRRTGSSSRRPGPCGRTSSSVASCPAARDRSRAGAGSRSSRSWTTPTPSCRSEDIRGSWRKKKTSGIFKWVRLSCWQLQCARLYTMGFF